MKDLKITALALELGVKTTDIAELDYKHNNYLTMYEIDGLGEYGIGSDDECSEACKVAILDTVWAFKASFIIENSNLPHEAIKMVQNFQETECESANDTILALLTDKEAFIKNAIGCDGRGHFLSNYDSQELEQTIKAKGVESTFYIYRTN